MLHCQEPTRSHTLQRLLQELARCGETLGVAPELLELDDFAVLARYDAEPTRCRLNAGCYLSTLRLSTRRCGSV